MIHTRGTKTFVIFLFSSGNELTTCLDFAPPCCNNEDAWSTGHIALGSVLINADVSDNHISKLGSLSKHPFLECLIAGQNLIRKIEGMSTLSFLQVLDLSNNDINVIQGLDNLPIRELNLAGNNILTLHGLDKLPELSFLNVSHNKITCLAPLKACLKLSFLDAQHNKLNIIRQVEFLKGLEWLRHLILLGNPASFIPFYRYCVVHIIPLIQFLDRTTVSVEEKIKSANMFNDEFSDVASRQVVFETYFPGETFRNFGPVFVDDESGVNLEALEEADNRLEALVREEATSAQ
jgi:Leucine-rich repeat (LRR) protein